MRLTRAILLATTALVIPAPAAAEPVSAFFIGLTAASGVNAAIASALGGLTSFAYAAGAFLGSSLLGNLLLGAAVSYALRPDAPKRPEIESARINSRLPDAERWQLAGSVYVGGEAGIFGEFDADGNFWYLVAHGDAEMVGDPAYFLDSIPVTLADRTTTYLDPVNAASIGNVDISNPPLMIDGVGVGSATAGSAFQRFLLKNQTNAAQNGVYNYNPTSGTLVLDEPHEAGDAVYVLAGNTNAETRWRASDSDPTVWEATSDIDQVPGDVVNEPFIQKGDEGLRKAVYRLYTVTPDVGSAYGAKPAEFTDAFPNLPVDFLLAGVCYTIVRVKALSLENRYKYMTWAGVIGLGEPAVTVYANFSRMFDPRNPAHDLNDPATWTDSDGNPLIVWAWFRTNPFGKNRPVSEINWDKVAEAADICDELVTNRSGEQVPRYRCGFAAKDGTARFEAEQEILKSCDGVIMHDDAGRAWVYPGKFQEPVLSFYRDRDVMAASTEIVDDGETAVDGVVVRYISPAHGYTKQPSAPWQNPHYYQAGAEPNYKYIDVLTCQDHNQAFRLAKAYGERFGPDRRAALGVGLKGILAKSERFIDLSYDAMFSGDHEIVTTVEEDPSGQASAFGVVPVSADRWEVAPEEEGVPPALAEDLEIDDSLPDPENVSVSVARIAGSTGGAFRIEATFAAFDRADLYVRFRYVPVGEVVWEYFTTDMEEERAYSALVSEGQSYYVQWRTVSAGGGASDWSAALEVVVSADNTPADLAGVSMSSGFGTVAVSGTAGSDIAHVGVRLYRSTTSDFGAAVAIGDVIPSSAGLSFAVTFGQTGGPLLVGDPGFDDAGAWDESGGLGISVSGGAAVCSPAASASRLTYDTAGIADGDPVRLSFEVSGHVAGSVYARVRGDAAVISGAVSSDGLAVAEVTADVNITNLGLQASTDADMSVDNFQAYVPGPDSVPQGAGYFWVVPVAFDDTEGTPDGPHQLTIR